MDYLKKYRGPVLCLLGLWLALTASAKPPANKGDWPDTLPYAVGGFMAALVGVALWRRQQLSQATEQSEFETTNSEFVNHEAIWTAFWEDFQRFHGVLPTLTLAEIFARLTYLQDHFILPLVQVRWHLFVGSDRESGLERLATFSRGELWMNRAQTTAGDQHREETLVALAWAKESFLAVHNSFSGQITQSGKG